MSARGRQQVSFTCCADRLLHTFCLCPLHGHVSSAACSSGYKFALAVLEVSHVV